ncbi:uncharacterized protein GIQ15_04872 [Arthroderma uncinatum]|uniref:uncharacterized protein n=1 Tax=Arthroderma uncinatum TaxID=74035 RepID=UPI00144A5E20|nr:uncharacterized protein GIQ15_04872 [Arthroderma uncinatum]KAF3482113.1 hypothetical protein GIQ15_04872 [Arthroderma uncinatum]
MATSQGVNVLRYSALFAGVFYGLYHQSTLNTQARAAQIEREYKRQESLIERAKTEFKNKNSPPKKDENSVISDPNDPRFDLEALLKATAAETAK